MFDNNVLFVRSSKHDGNTSTERNSTSEDDIWDDTLLIKAYDKAVSLAQQSYLKKKQDTEHGFNTKGKKKETEHKWKVGDKCRCQYSEDHKYYEADIIEILDSTGMCLVRYVGYENEEKVSLKKLKQSKGESARNKQCEDAANENEYKNNIDVDNDRMSTAGGENELPQNKTSIPKKGHFKKKNNSHENSFSSLGFPFPGMKSSIFPPHPHPPPPPPPPHMFNRLNEDENETEAMSAMLISWYMSGYHTGYYHGLKMAQKQ